ncbi:insulin-like growth factor I, adult form [Patella vulgata]|uniref:insulin-like growth factor I, adult form n=1 Tax=Patella vulgata TaxID=6465 RepID=UPI0024A86329|nr:insulin-like growth factor I, adult form [Patella vulgata]
MLMRYMLIFDNYTLPMKTYYQLVALAIFLSLGLSEQAMPERLCGRNLADALDLVCYDRGFHWEVRKRSGMPVLSKRHNTMTSEIIYGKRSYSNRRGVVEECCYIGCNYDILESYCAQPGDDAPGSGSRILFGRTTARPIPVPQTTPPPPVVTTPSHDFPSAVFNSNHRRGHAARKHFFYVQLGTRPTRSPLI